MDTHRLEILFIDFVHWVLILSIGLTILGMEVAAVIAEKTGVRVWIPVIAPILAVLAMRLDIMIKRKGAWLANQGDGWEKALATHGPTQYLMPWADAMLFLPFVALIIHAQYQSWFYFENPTGRWLYLTATTLFLVVAVVGWITAATKSRTGF